MEDYRNHILEDPHFVPQCSKCGYQMWKVVYKEEMFPVRINTLIYEEHLECTCCGCGYRKAIHCKDYKPKEEICK